MTDVLFRRDGLSLLALFTSWLPALAAAGELIPSGPYVADPYGPIVVGYYAPEARKVKFRSSTGTAVDAVRSDDGIIRAKWTPPKVTAATSADLTLVIDGAEVAIRVALVPPPLGRASSYDGALQLPVVRFEGVPTELPTTATPLAVRAQVEGAMAAPWFLAQGGSVVVPKITTPPPDGLHSATVKLPASAPFLVVAAGAAMSTSTLPAYRTFAFADRNTTIADGKSAIGIVVVAVDRMGAPVPKIDLQLSVPDGDGRVPAKAKTDANGVALIAFTPGTRPGFTSVRIHGAAVVGEFPLFLTQQFPPQQVPPQQSPPPLSPTNSAVAVAPNFTDLGDAEYRVWSRAWRDAIAVPSAAAPPPVPPPPPLPAPTPKPDSAGTAPSKATSSLGHSQSSAPSVGTSRAQKADTVSADSRAAADPDTQTPTASAPRASRSSPPASESALRITGDLWATRGRYKVERTLPAVAAADFGAPMVGFWGLRADASWHAGPALGGSFFVEGGANALSLGLAMPNGNTVVFLPQLWAHAALRKPLNEAVSWQVGIGVDHHASLLFAYTDDARLAGLATPEGSLGARVSGAAIWHGRRLLARAELAEVLAPMPVLTQASLRVDAPLDDGLWATGGVRLDAQHLGRLHDGDGVSGGFVLPAMTIGVAYTPSAR